MANRPNSPRASWPVAVAGALVFLITGNAFASCPFCVAVQPSWAQQRERADAVAIGEFQGATGRGQRFVVRQLIDKRAATVAVGDEIQLETAAPRERGQLAILLGTEIDGELAWQAIDADETVLGYFARSPSLRVPAGERLRYFARYLEHADPRIAEDAYLEFGHAPFDEVAPVADALDSRRLQAWLEDERVPQHRKGFYGLALGLPRPEAQRRENLAALTAFMHRGDNDFRAGFDGILAGYLLAGGEEALGDVEARFLAPADAAEGDSRHAVRAVRFYREFGREVPPARLAASMRLLLARPGFAAEAIADLARWQDWSCLAEVAALYDAEGPFAPAVRRSVIGYLATCPRAEAATLLENMRAKDPTGVDAVLVQLGLLDEGS